jgi:NAD(P)-dependent dehydrogenase (short-subunit alcohol dehydrogenase family)
MNLPLENKVALVTGGTSGIGKAAALALAKAGAKVVVAGRREEEGNRVVEAVKQAGGAAFFVKADVAHEADVKSLVDQTVAHFGKLDIAFNNAGTEGQVGHSTEAQTVEDYQSVSTSTSRGSSCP